MTEPVNFEPYPFSEGVNGMTLRAFFVWCARHDVSDIHIQGGSPLVVSHHGRLRQASTFALADDTLSKLVDEVLTPEVRATARGGYPVDRALQLDGDMYQRYGLARGERLRLRCNIVQATAGRLDTTLALTLRIIPSHIPALDSLGIEPALREVVLPHQGLALVGGETGSGKSTLLASVYRHCIDQYPDRKVTTTEDPIEFVLGRSGDILPATQLQIGRDVASFAEGIRADLRRAPSVIGVAEMRDRETIEAGVMAGQLGHTCLSTLHIHSQGEAIPRCLHLFPAEVREAVAYDMLAVLQYIVVQKLLRTTDGRRQAVREYIILDEPLRETLSGMPYMTWGRHIDGVLRQEKRRIADQAWCLYQQGCIDETELPVAMSAGQLRELREGR